MIQSPLFFRKKHMQPVTILCLVFLFLCIVINPLREFPLSDDWTHTLAVYTFVKTGEFFYPAWLSAYSFLNILYGSILTSLFGFSFSILRISNLVFALGTVLLFCLFLKRIGCSDRVRLIGGLLLLFSPIFLNLSFTFMGDIPALFFFLAALFFFFNGMRAHPYRNFIFGALCTILAFSIRQTMLVPLLAATPLYMMLPKIRKEIIFALFLGSGGLITAMLLAAYYGGALVSPPVLLFLPLWKAHIHPGILMTFLMVTLTGFTLLPIAASLIPHCAQQRWRISTLITIILSLTAATSFSYFALLQQGNIITVFGMGLIPEVLFFWKEIMPWGGMQPYIFAILLSLAGLVLIAKVAPKPSWNEYLRAPFSLLILTAALYTAGIIIFLPVFDRYFLPLIPLVIIIGLKILERVQWTPLLLLVVLIMTGMYSVVGTINYLAWNDARWTLGRRMDERGVPQQQLDGGYEWNGWFSYREKIDPLFRGVEKKNGAQINAFFHGEAGQEYHLSFSPVEGYNVIDREPIRGLLFQVPYLYVIYAPLNK